MKGYRLPLRGTLPVIKVLLANPAVALKSSTVRETLLASLKQDLYTRGPCNPPPPPPIHNCIFPTQDQTGLFGNSEACPATFCAERFATVVTHDVFMSNWDKTRIVLCSACL